MTHSKSEPPTEVMTPQDQAIGAMHRWSRFWQNRMGLTRPHFGLAIGWSLLAATAVITHPVWVQRGDRQVQSFFWSLHPSPPPENIVILAIDEATQGRISRWPLPRATYATVIDRVMQAGARGVAVDILFDNPSGGPSGGNDSKLDDPNLAEADDCTQTKLSGDDLALHDAIARYPGRITLATAFATMTEGDAITSQRLLLPFCPFQTAQSRLGNIDFPEENGVIYRLGNDFLQTLIAQNPAVYQTQIQDYQITTFAEAALESAQLDYTKHKTGDIYFQGGPRTFEIFSLADVIQPENWKSRFRNGELFRDKLVLIGATDQTLSDIKETAVGKMPGVELHANAIATLLQRRALRPVGSPLAIGAIVLLAVMLAAVTQARLQTPQWRLLGMLGWMLGWAGMSDVLMIQASLLLPTLVPIGAIGLVGVSYIGLDVAKERRSRRQLEKSLIDRARDPVIKDILDQQTDVRLKERIEMGQQELLGAKIGGGRYQIIQIHGAGGFGETYIAEDLHRPERPTCVVKKLSPASSNPKHLKLARRLFQREAETLELLGQQHDQIPQLLAYFEEASQFYLVQEFIAGHPLSSEVSLGRQLPETKAIAVLREVLQVLSFVHSQGVIHRDIKPSNLIRRSRDNKLVLIDFGAVKEVQTAGDDEIVSDLTIGIGTQGYMAPEQQAGHPQFSSDLYALGMMGVQMLTGISPSHLTRDPDTGEVDWQTKTHASVGLVELVSKMICYHYKQRYQSAADVLQDLRQLSYYASIPAILTELIQESIPGDEDMQDTQPWPTQFDDDDEADLPPTALPPE
jgi:CHASE2 domain-containing sensor protein/tRNA A-37 threonylcarbamoyl transferase component Bud32